MIAKIKLFLKRLCNWRFLVCFLIAWMITNGWAYFFIGFGTFCNIGWMLAIGSTYMAFLWMPFTPEKLITIPIALFLLKILFPKQKELHKKMQEENEKIKKEEQEKKEKKKNKKKDVSE